LQILSLTHKQDEPIAKDAELKANINHNKAIFTSIKMAEPSISRVYGQDDVNDDNDSIDFYSDTNSPKKNTVHQHLDVNTLDVSSESINPINSLPGLGIPALAEHIQTPKGEESDFDVYDLSMAEPTVVNHQPVVITAAVETSMNDDSDMDMYDPESVKLNDDFVQPTSAGALNSTSEPAFPIIVQAEPELQAVVEAIDPQLEEEEIEFQVKEKDTESYVASNATELQTVKAEIPLQVNNEAIESQVQQSPIKLQAGSDEIVLPAKDIQSDESDISTDSDEDEEPNATSTTLQNRQEFIELAKANEADPEAEFQFDEDFEEEDNKAALTEPAKLNPTTEIGPVTAKSGSDGETDSDSDSDSSTDSKDSSGSVSDDGVEGEDIQAKVRRLMEDADQATSTLPLKTENEVEEVFEPIPDIEVTPDMSIEELGLVSNILLDSSIIVVKGNLAANEFVLDHGTVVCLEDRTLIGVVAEPFGKSAEPYYKIGFANRDDITKFNLQDGVKIFRLSQHSNFVFVPQLLKEKHTDASGEADEEHAKQEFSDDDEERAFKRQKRQNNKQARGGKGARGNNKPRNAQNARGSSNNRGWRGRGGFRPGRYHDYDGNGDAGNVQRDSSVTMKYDDNDDDDDDGYKPLRRPDNYQQLYSSAPQPPPSAPKQPEQRFDPRDGRGRGFRGGFDRGRGNGGFGRGRGNAGFNTGDRQDQNNLRSFSRDQSSSRRSPSTIRSFNGGQDDGKRGRNDDRRPFQRENRNRNRSRSPYRRPKSQTSQQDLSRPQEAQNRSGYQPSQASTSIGSYAPFYPTSTVEPPAQPRGMSQYAPYDESRHNQSNGSYQGQDNSSSSYQSQTNASSYQANSSSYPPPANYPAQNQQLSPAILASLGQYVGAAQNNNMQNSHQNNTPNAQANAPALYAFQQMIMNSAQQRAPQATQLPTPHVPYQAPTPQSNTDHASREADDRLRALLQALGGQGGNWQPPR
jgi:rRNA processing protein Gar1